ncbi:MAG: hypothetical protein P8J30_02700, partial [Ilumatobacter sp.]|nr:hypothetical protein [Ilumatobacter sp.]
MNLTLTVTHPSRKLAATGIALAIALAACGSDDSSSSGTSAPGTADPTPDTAALEVDVDPPADEPKAPTEDATSMDVGYAYATNVDSHRLVVVDVCDVEDLLDSDPFDVAAINGIYTDGKNSVKD